MNDNTDLAARVRDLLTEFKSIREVKMFGGLSFMKDDQMVACISKDVGCSHASHQSETQN